jgi:hypothetical protein
MRTWSSSARAAGGRACRRALRSASISSKVTRGPYALRGRLAGSPRGRLSEFKERKLLFEVVLEPLW